MWRDVTTTVRVKLHSLTERKARLIEREHNAFCGFKTDRDANAAMNASKRIFFYTIAGWLELTCTTSAARWHHEAVPIAYDLW